MIWTLSVPDQLVDFLLSLPLGALLMLLYDLLRGMRRAGLPSRPAAVAVTDVLFGAAAAQGIFLFCLTRTEGVVRGYVLLGCAVGAAAAGRFLSRPLTAAIARASRFLLRRSRLRREMAHRVAQKIKKAVRFKKKQPKQTEKCEKTLDFTGKGSV